ncbi:MAG: mechanosensitive ion channel [Deferrisomatales bacterium]|nr:mechanosensitive ion channel [Deferrisomatales bacterium]
MAWNRLGLVVTVACLLRAASVVAAEPVVSPPAVSLETPTPAPVVVWGRTIAVLRAAFEESSPKDRAERAVARMGALPPRGDLKVVTANASRGGISGIMIGTQTEMLFALLPGDVDPDSGQTLEQFADRAAKTLQEVLGERAAQLRWSILLRGLGVSAAATMVFVGLLWSVWRVREVAIHRLDRRIGASRRRLALAGIDLIPLLLGIERALLKLTALVVMLAASYVWLTFCFQQFFYTQPWARQLGAFFLGMLRDFALGIVGAVPGLVAVLVIFWLTRIVAAGASRFFTGVERGTMTVSWLNPDSARASRRIVLAGIWLFAVTVAYPYIPGSGSDAFKGVSVFAGLMLSLGSSGFVNHLMSGLVIAYSGAMRVGDYVTVGAVEGTVQDLGPMTTKIATPKREAVAIPNGVVVGASVTNYTLLAGRDGAIVSTTITIGYDTPWRQVHALLLQAAGRTTGIRQLPAPFVLQRALSDFYVEYELRFAIDRPVERAPVLSELHAAIQDAFNAAGVQIMSPNFETQPEQPVLVPRDQWYAAPAAPPETVDAADRPAR